MAIVCVAVLTFNNLCEHAAVEALIPVFRLTLATIQSDFVLQSIDIVTDGPNDTLRVRANLTHPVVIGGRTFFPIGYGTPYTGGYQATMTTGGVVIYSVLLLIVVFSWPATHWKQWIRRLSWAATLAFALIIINVAVTIPAQLWIPIHNSWVPDVRWSLLEVSKLIMGGAGLMIALILGIAVVLFSQRDAVDRREEVGAAEARTC